MKRMVKRAGTALVATLLVSTGCAYHPGMERGMDTFGRGLMNLVLSPFMIVGGIAEGLAFLPYTLGMGLDDFNRSLRQANAVTMDDAYRATFSVSSIADPRVDRATGNVAGEHFGFGQFRPGAMLEASQALQRLLVSQGMAQEKAEQYVIIGNYSQARTRGHILIAVAYRHRGDVQGQMIDEVVDWAGIEYAELRRDRVVATLMVLAAESVKADKRSPEYWAAERRWAAGASSQVMAESSARVRQALSRS